MSELRRRGGCINSICAETQRFSSRPIRRVKIHFRPVAAATRGRALLRSPDTFAWCELLAKLAWSLDIYKSFTCKWIKARVGKLAKLSRQRYYSSRCRIVEKHAASLSRWILQQHCFAMNAAFLTRIIAMQMRRVMFPWQKGAKGTRHSNGVI